MALNSVAVFKERVKECQLMTYWERFELNGWTTLGAFAFAANHMPGNPDETSFVVEVVIPILGVEASPLKAMLRRLHFEAYSMIAEDARRRSMRSEDDDKPRKLPQAEKAVRIKAVREELVGLDITGDLEPSDNVVDRLVAMQEDGILKYLRWEEIGRRDTEIRGAKRDTYWKTDSNGLLREHSSIVELPADTSTDLKIKTMLQRRGVALQMARLMSFKLHETWVSRLFKELSRDPLPGYAKFSLAQMIRVDQEFFAELAELTRAGLGLSDDGSLPLDPLVPTLMASTRIGCLLNPLPGSNSRRETEQAPRVQREDPRFNQRGEKRKLQDERSNKQGKAEGKGKGNGKAKKQGAKPKSHSTLPSELIGLNSSFKGKPVCYSYNLDGCSNTCKDNACARGMHLCMKCGVGGHSQRGCKAALITH